MRIHKFEGATMRDAIAKVKAELGDQAVIISTRNVRRGLLGSAVEIAAAIDTDEADAGPVLSGPTTGGTQPASSPPGEPDLEKLIAPLRSELRSLRALVRSSGDSRSNTELRSEIAALRQIIENLPRAAAPAPTAPVRARTATPHDAARSRTTPSEHNAPL